MNFWPCLSQPKMRPACNRVVYVTTMAAIGEVRWVKNIHFHLYFCIRKIGLQNVDLKEENKYRKFDVECNEYEERILM